MKPSQILKETTIPQIKHAYIRFNDNQELEGKCALGVLACESPNTSYHLDKNNRVVSDAEFLLETLGVDKMGELLYLSSPTDKSYAGFTEYNEDEGRVAYRLPEIIILLNDTWGLSFKEIGEFLEVTFGI